MKRLLWPRFLGVVLTFGLLGCGSASLHETYLLQREADAASARALVADAPSEAAELDAWLAGQHQRLAQERATAQQHFAQAEQACWQRFAVNDCLRQARQQRRQSLDALHEQELQLNLFERERAATERLRRLERKQPTP